MDHNNKLPEFQQTPARLSVLADRQEVITVHENKNVLTKIVWGFENSINGLFGVVLTTSDYNERLARCGFNYLYKENSFLINHTPQGRFMDFVSKEGQKTFNKIRDFRSLMLKDVITLGASLNISKIQAVGAVNHSKVTHNIISLERATQIIDTPLLEAGFNKMENGDFSYEYKEV